MSEEAGFESAGSEGEAVAPTDRRPRFAIIGAGFSGLAAAYALKQAGLEYDHLEAQAALGGNWSHGVYETVHIVSSRRTTQLDEYPMPAETPDFPSAAQMLDYLQGYARHFELDSHIEFHSKITDVRALEGAGFELSIETPTGSARRFYKGVVICNGHHWQRRIPEYPGEFAGESLHSKDYKSPEQLKGKRVLVVGGGNSGCDIAVEAARFADAAHISLRRGYWFLPKTIMGRPTVEFLHPAVPVWLQRLFLKLAIRLIFGRYEQYGLERPRHKIFERHPTINSQLLYFLKHGTIKAHKDIARFESQQVHFQDASQAELDMVIYATGYHVRIPFVDDSLITWQGDYPDLVVGVLSPRCKNLYVLGLGQPRYGAGPLLSKGARLVAEAAKVQDKLQYPVGRLLEKLGQGRLQSYLMDPHVMMRRARMGAWLMPKMPRIERWLQRLGAKLERS